MAIDYDVVIKEYFKITIKVDKFASTFRTPRTKLEKTRRTRSLRLYAGCTVNAVTDWALNTFIR